jgi:orotidine-5'-phosphate decarboxylase
MSARDAIDAGASSIVVGRPIIAAADPREAAARIAAEITAAQAGEHSLRGHEGHGA